MIRSPFVTALLLVSLSAPVAAADFVLDKAHTQAEFVLGGLALSPVHGKIPLRSGTAIIGADNLPTGVDATFDVTSLSTQNKIRDVDIRDTYFQVAQYPTIRFVERQAQGTPQAFTMTGDLTIHGVTKPITLAAKVDSITFVKGKKHLAFTATTTIDLRNEYAITFSPLLDGAIISGGDVTINIKTDAIEQ
ncbi:MAG: YceI family protein [Candidatus Lustribacter sp.]|jgi:polyisoprenoid-binding protein YceI